MFLPHANDLVGFTRDNAPQTLAEVIAMHAPMASSVDDAYDCLSRAAARAPPNDAAALTAYVVERDALRGALLVVGTYRTAMHRAMNIFAERVAIVRRDAYTP